MSCFQAGFDIVWLNERDIAVCKTYRFNSEILTFKKETSEIFRQKVFRILMCLQQVFRGNRFLLQGPRRFL